MKKKKQKVDLKKEDMMNSIVILDSDDDDDDVDENGSEVDEDVEMNEREHLSILDDNVEDEEDDIRVVKRVKKVNRVKDECCMHEMGHFSDVEEEIENGMENEYDGEDGMEEHHNHKKKKERKSKKKFKKTFPRRGNKTLRGNIHAIKRPLGDLCASLMSHTPCGPDVPGGTKRECWRHGRCKKKFPRPQVQETNASIDGYPLYRRRELLDQDHPDEMPKRYKYLAGQKVKITNQYLPGFNAPMLLRYRLHENVEGTHGMSTMVI